MAEKQEKQPCQHNIVCYLGRRQNTDPGLPFKEMGVCQNEDCGLTVDIGNISTQDKYTWFVELDVYEHGEKKQRKIYIKNKDFV